MKPIRLLISVFMFALSMNGWCDEFVVDGIKYSTNEDNISVSVISNSYEGNIVIPSTVAYDGKSYSVTDIGGGNISGAFSGCSSLTSITIPSSVTSIGQYAFRDCSGLTSVTIPSSVTSIRDGAFLRCYVDSSKVTNNSEFDLETKGLTICIRLDNGVCIKDNAFIKYLGNETSITIPSSVTSIGKSAFSGCSGLMSVSIPNSVTSIGESAFYNCDGLMSVSIPSSVTSIGESAFQSCSGLMSVSIPSSVTSIGKYAFRDCSGLTSVTIPSSVTSIRDGAFSGCI